ncbi:DNA-binding response regulator, partial [Ralstonia pseudosolanacearum]
MCPSSTAPELPSIRVAIVEDDSGFLDALTQA